MLNNHWLYTLAYLDQNLKYADDCFTQIPVSDFKVFLHSKYLTDLNNAVPQPQTWSNIIFPK